MSRIGTTPLNIDNEPRYGGGIFNLDTYRSDAANTGKVFVVFSINVADSAVAGSWLDLLGNIASDLELRCVASCFYHNGSFQDMMNDNQVNDAVDAASISGTEFPICRFSSAAASNWLAGIIDDNYDYGDPAYSLPSASLFSDGITGSPQMWAYIIDIEGNVSDKWHHQRVNDPLAVVHCLPLGTMFPSGDISTWTPLQISNLTSALAARCVNLRSLLKILDDSVNPPSSDVQTAFSNPVEIAFSRPLDTSSATPVTDTSLYTLGGKAVSAGAGNPSSAVYVGADFIENVVNLSFPGVSLSDAAGWNMTIDFPGIHDASGGGPDTGEEGLSWIVNTSTPQISSAALANPPNDVSGFTVGISPILVDISFSEALPVQPVNMVTVTENPGSSNPSDSVTFSHTEGDNTGRLSFAVSDINTDGRYHLEVAAGAITDAAAVVNTAPWAMDIVYDAAPPRALISMDVNENSDTSSNLVSVTVDFGEEVAGFPDPSGTSPEISSSSGILTYEPDGSQQTFRYSLELDTPGAVSVSVAAGAVQDIPLGRDSLPSISPYTFNYVPSYKNVVVAVDISGSMGWLIPFDSGSGPVQTPKWSVMKPRIQTFLARMNIAVGLGTVHENEDRLALITYNSSAHQADLGGSPWCESGDVGDPLNPGSLDNAIDGISCGGDTAMGDAISMAYGLLDAAAAPNREGSIILFADGQNSAGMDLNVLSGPDRFEIGNPGNPPALSVVRGAANYPIYAIGIHTELASADTWLTTLANVADISGGVYYDVTEVDTFPDSEDALSAIITAIYSANTPVLIKTLHGTIPPGEEHVALPFALDSESSGFMVSLSWPGVEKARFVVENDGRPLLQYRRSADAAQHSIASVRFPHIQTTPFYPRLPWPYGGFKTVSGPFPRHYRPPWNDAVLIPPKHRYTIFEADANWRVTVFRRGRNTERPLQFFLALMSEERIAAPKLHFTKPPHLTNKSFEAVLAVSAEMLRISDASLSLEYTAVSLANIVAEKAKHYPGTPVQFHPDASGIQDQMKELFRKRNLSRYLAERDTHLLRRPEVCAALKHRKIDYHNPAEIQTQPSGGICRWKLSGFPYPGHYRLVFRIRGRSRKTGEFERTVARSIVVLPGIDMKKSILSYELDPRTLWFTARVIPQDSKGNLFGAGYSHRIRSFSRIRESFSITDLLDGSYLVKGRYSSFKPGRSPLLRLFFTD